MVAIITCNQCPASQPTVAGKPGRVIHIAAGIEKRTGEKPVLRVGKDGEVVIPRQYLAVMGLAGGGSIRFTPSGRGFAIERVDAADRPG